MQTNNDKKIIILRLKKTIIITSNNNTTLIVFIYFILSHKYSWTLHKIIDSLKTTSLTVDIYEYDIHLGPSFSSCPTPHPHKPAKCSLTHSALNTRTNIITLGPRHMH